MKVRTLLLTGAAIVALIATASCKKDQPPVAAATDTAATEPQTGQGDETAGTTEAPAATPTQEPTSNADMTNEQRVEMALAMIEEIMKIFADNKGDCDAIADGILKFVEDNKAKIEMGKDWDKDPEFKKLFDEKSKARIEAAGPPMMAAMKDCEGHEKLDSAMQKLAD